MTETPTTPTKPKRRMRCELDILPSTGRGMRLPMASRADLALAHDRVRDAMISGLGVVDIVTNNGRASIDTGQICAVSSQVYWISERDFSDDF